MSDIDRFEWDHGNRDKCQKHGVSIAEIENVFRGDVYIAQDPKHSTLEDRFVAIGLNAQGRPVFVIFTRRSVGDRDLIRPVSARYMHRKEYGHYEELWRAEGAKDADG